MRYSLLGLFGVVTLCAGICAVAVWYSRLDCLRTSNIGTIYIARAGTSVCIRPESDLNSAALIALLDLDPPVKELIVKDRPWSNDLAKWMIALPELRSIQFHQCKGFDDRFTAALNQSGRLGRLELRNCDVSKIDFPAQSSICILVLDGSNVTDEQMQPLAGYQLAGFSANRTHLTENGVAPLRGKQLSHVCLIDTPVSEAAIVRLLDDTGVRRIEVSERQFSQDAFWSHPRGDRVMVRGRNWLTGRERESGWSPKFSFRGQEQSE